MKPSICRALLERFGPTPRALAVFACDELAIALKRADILVSFAESPEAIELYARASLDLVIVDAAAAGARHWPSIRQAAGLDDVPMLLVEDTPRGSACAPLEPSGTDAIDLAEELGATEVIRRPLDRRELERRIHLLAELGRHRRVASIADLVAEAGTNAVTIADASHADHPFVWVNDAFERLTGYSRAEILGQSGRVLQGPDTDPRALAALAEALRLGVAVETKVLNYRKDGGTFWNAVSIRPVRDAGGHLRYFVGVLSDVTPRVAGAPLIVGATPAPRPIRLPSTSGDVELSARRVERLAAMGTMVAGFAHEVRNPVSAMRSLIELLDEETPSPDPRRATLVRIERHLDRIERLVQSSLRFGRPDEPKRTWIAPEKILEEAVDQLASRTGDLGSIRRTITPPVPDVFVDEAQVSQAIVALLNNALDAVGYPDQIVLELDTYATSDERGVRVRVRDFGSGIQPHILSRIFDPFFTTKASGTGLGLSIAQRLIHDNGGRLEVSSSLGLGSTFTVLVPTPAEAVR
ncbi:PAS domain-containing protein [Myxococcota bacterium]|nr:PAS domain-containing protein [Myxococcota bacterium]